MKSTINVKKYTVQKTSVEDAEVWTCQMIPLALGPWSCSLNARDMVYLCLCFQMTDLIHIVVSEICPAIMLLIILFTVTLSCHFCTTFTCPCSAYASL